MRQFKILFGALLSCATLNVCAAPPNDAYTIFIVDTFVEDSCEVSVQNLSFAIFNPMMPVGSQNGQASANIYVTCTLTTPYTIHLTEGRSGDLLARGMFGSTNGNYINYQLYVDNNRKTVWGNGSSNTSSNGGTGSGATQTHVVYAQMTSNGPGTIIADTYTDTIQISIMY